VGVHVIRTITVVSAFLLATNSIVHAEDRASSLVNLGLKPYQWGFERQQMYGVDMNMSPREYEEIYSRNRRFARKALMSYSKDALESIGMPEQGVNLMGTALGLVINGPRLDLNKSKTLALEFRDAGDPERALYLGVDLDW
jgi:hypothetical protein